MRRRILFILEDFSPKSETFVYNQITHCSKEAEVYVYCQRRTNEDRFPFNDFYESKPPATLKSKIIDKIRYRHRYYLLHDPHVESELGIVIKQFQPDAMVVHFGPVLLKVIKNLGNYSGPVFSFFHGYDASKLIKRSSSYVKQMKSVLESNRVFPIAVSNFIRMKVIKAFSVNEEVPVVYLGINAEDFTPKEQKVESSTKRFIQVSRFVEKKGIEFTIEAFAKFSKKYPDRDFSYTLIGDGPLEASLKELSSNLEMDSKIKFTGPATQAGVIDWLRSSDVYIQNSITASTGDTEGLPISIMEAMAVNLPVIVSRHAGIPELVEDGINGFLTTERDVDSIVDALDKYWSSNFISNRQKILEQFSIEKSVSNLMRLIEAEL